QNNFDLELAINTNRLRERTGWNFYIFGGLGFNHLNLKGDYLNSSSLLYDYTSGNPSGDVETNLPKSSSELSGDISSFKWQFMPSLRFGISRQLGPAVSIGIEHKTLFTRSDYLDGNAYVNTDGTNDLFHYTSLGLNIYIGAGRGVRAARH